MTEVKSKKITNHIPNGSWSGIWRSTRYHEEYHGTISFTTSEATGNYPSIEVKFLGTYNNGQIRTYCGVIKNQGLFDTMRLNIFVHESLSVDSKSFTGQLYFCEIANVYILAKCEQVFDEEICFCQIL